MRVFVDTSFLFALASRKDPDHQRVREVFESFDPARLPELWITTNHVVFETVRLARRKISHEVAVSMARRLYSEKLACIHWATPKEEKDAIDYLARYGDKKYSPVDCLSFVVMDAYGIGEALTLDKDFTHRFIARPGPRTT